MNELTPSPDEIPILPMGVEMQIMQSEFLSSWIEHLHNMVLTNIKIINRSANQYDDVRLGIFMDPDVGGYDDDLVGCDPELDLAFAYNSSSFDGPSLGALGYGEHPPAVGCAFLNSHLLSHVTFERISPNSQITDPSTVAECWRVLNGQFADGDPVLTPTGDTTTFIYYGDPNTPGDWTMPLPTPATVDVRTISATGPFTLAPGDTLCVDLAFVFAQDSAGDNLSSVALLKDHVAQVREWYQQQNVQCNGSYGLVTDVISGSKLPPLLIHPNPAQDHVTITGPSSPGPVHLSILDARGQQVMSRDQRMTGGSATVTTDGLTNGLYLVKVQSAGIVSYGRLVIAR